MIVGARGVGGSELVFCGMEFGGADTKPASKHVECSIKRACEHMEQAVQQMSERIKAEGYHPCVDRAIVSDSRYDADDRFVEIRWEANIWVYKIEETRPTLEELLKMPPPDTDKEDTDE